MTHDLDKSHFFVTSTSEHEDNVVVESLLGRSHFIIRCDAIVNVSLSETLRSSR